MARFLRKISTNDTLFALALIALTAIITHALIIPRLGYYYDDWYMLWSGASRGSKSLIPLFAVDRPFMGYVYFVLYRVLRDNILGWHLITLAVRILSGLGFYWITRLIWPKYRSIALVCAMIFVVFPGFLAEPNAATKINHLIGYSAALFSIALTLKAASAPTARLRISYTALSLLLLAVYLWIYEYMIGLEVMRLALLFWMIWRGQRGKMILSAKQVGLSYLPYLAVIGAFLFWRVAIFESTRDATDLSDLVGEYQDRFFEMSTRLIIQTIKDFFSASLFAWFVQPYALLAKAEFGQILRALLVGAAGGLLGWLTLRRIHKVDAAGPEEESPWVLVLIGAFIVLGAVFPVVLSNRFLDLMNAYKGYALHPSAGVMIAVIGMVAMLRPRFQKAALVFLLTLSVVTNVLNNQVWADFWEVQRNFWWQLTWRAPDLQDDTVVVAYLPDSYAFQQDYEVWGPVNLIYRYNFLSQPHIQSEVLNQGTLLDMMEGKYIDPYVRDIFVPKDFRNLLVISQPTTHSCVHVIDGSMPALSSEERLIVEKVSRFSRIERINPQAATPAPKAAIFGQEPDRDWCYYYQQASLARQTGDWARIAALYDSVKSENLEPGDQSETFVFIEGLVNAGRVDEARLLAEPLRANANLKYGLCTSLNHASGDQIPAGYQHNQVKAMICP